MREICDRMGYFVGDVFVFFFSFLFFFLFLLVGEGRGCRMTDHGFFFPFK